MISLKTMGWRNRLLQTSAITAVSLVAAMSLSGEAQAVDQVLGATGGNTALSPGAANTIVERGTPADTDTGEFDVNGNVTWGSNTVKSVNLSTNSGTIYVYDSADAGADNAADNTATFNGDVSIVSGKTLTFVLGDDEDSGTGAVSVNMHFSDSANSDIFMGGATAATRGGTVIFQSAPETSTNVGTNTVTFDGNVNLTSLQVSGGAAGNTGGQHNGAGLTATFGNSASDSFNVTGLTVTGGAGDLDAAAVNVGGTANVTVNSQATIGATGVTMTGGVGGGWNVGNTGGAANLTFNSTATIAGVVNVTAGDAPNAGGTDSPGGAAVITFNGATTLSSAMTVTGGGHTGQDGHGGDASAVFNANVTSSSSLALVSGGFVVDETLGIAGDATATFSGNTTFSGITLERTTTNNGTAGSVGVTFNGTGTQSVTGTINAATGAGEGTVTVSNTGGKVTFNSAIGNTLGVASVTTNASSNVKFNSTVNSAAMVVNGMTEFDDAVTVGNAAAGTLTFANGVLLQVGNQIVNGETLFTTTNGGTAYSAGAVVLRMPSNFTAGTITLIDDTAIDISARTTQFGVVDTALTDFTVQSNAVDNTKMDVTARQKTAEQTASELGSSVNEARAMGAAVNGNHDDNTIIDAYTTALYAGGSEARKAAEQSVSDPTGGGSIRQVAQSNAQAGFDIMSSRLSAVRPGGKLALGTTGPVNGVASGDAATNGAGWIKPYATRADQDMRDGVYGYKATTAGLLGGLDGSINDKARIGVALGYSQSNVKSDSSSNLKQDIDSYQGALYGDYTGDGWYVEAMAGYAYHDITAKRTIDFGGLNTSAKGSYHASQYTSGATVGMPIVLDQTQTITPVAGLTYSYLNGGQYTETGAGGLNQTVNVDDTQALVGKLGVKYNAFLPAGTGKLIPELRAAALYDFIGDEAKSTSTFAGGTSYTTNGADVAQLGGVFGAGLAYSGENALWSVGLDYDAEVREGFLAHNGQLEVRVKF